MKRWTTSAEYHVGRRAVGRAPQPHTMALTDTPDDTSPAVEQITAWLARLRLLHGVPFHYLLPDQRMLPQESIRFFEVDPNWLTALIDGAFSVGRSTTGDDAARLLSHHLSARLTRHAPNIRAGHLGLRAAAGGEVPPQMTGFVLRSGVVAGWPTMEVQAFDADNQLLTTLRLERAAGNILFALFAGKIQRVKFREPSETLHFGGELRDSSQQPVVKKLKYLNMPGYTTGKEMDPVVSVDFPWRDQNRQVVDVLKLQDQIRQTLQANNGMPKDGEYTAAQFALEMVQGVQEVDFIIS